MNTCKNKLLNGNQAATERCGFIKSNKESVVLYIIYNKQTYVSLFYCEGKTNDLKTGAKQQEDGICNIYNSVSKCKVLKMSYGHMLLTTES